MNLKIAIPKNPGIAIKMLVEAGFEAGIVGGCTRDAILGEIPDDFDICTSAKPNEIQRVFRAFRQLTIGLKHGTVTVIIDNEKIEITTYRIEGKYSDGRRPDEVSFTRNLIEDLSRRDYTQNAIFFNEYIGIIDPFNGVSDIENKVIRCVGNPSKRLQEDALRILRGIRFSSKLGFAVEEKTKSSMFAYKELLNNISQERITEEFIKILQGKNAVKVLQEFEEIIAYIIPEIKEMIGFDQHNPNHIYDIWKHTLVSVNNAKGLILKLTMLFHDIGKPCCFTIDEGGIGHFQGHGDISSEITSKIFKRMKMTCAKGLSGNDLADIIELIKYHYKNIEPNKKSVNKILSKLKGGKTQLERLLLVKRADALAQSPDKIINSLKNINDIHIILNEILEENTCTTLKNLDISGKDLIFLGIPQGKKIGEILNGLLQDVLNENIENKKNLLIEHVKKIYML